jgi:hypothetical protein
VVDYWNYSKREVVLSYRRGHVSLFSHFEFLVISQLWYWNISNLDMVDFFSLLEVLPVACHKRLHHITQTSSSLDAGFEGIILPNLLGT